MNDTKELVDWARRKKAQSKEYNRRQTERLKQRGEVKLTIIIPVKDVARFKVEAKHAREENRAARQNQSTPTQPIPQQHQSHTPPHHGRLSQGGGQ